MKDYDRVRITYDRAPDTYVRATAYRAVLERFGLCVTLHPLREEGRLRPFFASPTDACFTIVCCHGWGKQEKDAVICFEVGRPKNEVEWERYEFHLTPGNIASAVSNGAGIMLMDACWSGKQVFADAFLKAGYECYIAPEKTCDGPSAMEFVTVLFGGLMWGVRDEARRTLTVREAVERARRIDDFRDGANGFRLFEKRRC